MSNQKINILCSCGSDKFEIPSNPKPSDTIICIKCGAQEKYGVLQKEIESKAKKQVEDALQKMLKKAGFR